MPSFSDKFNLWCQTTSCHGFPQFAASKSRTAKVFWFLLILSLAIQLIFYAGTTVARFFNPSARWGTRIEEIREMKLFHPSVTICNYNRYRKSIVNQLNISHDFLSYRFSMNPSRHYLHTETISNKTRKEFREWKKKTNITEYEMMVMGSHKCEDMVKMLKMTYDDRQHEISNPCNSPMEVNHVTLKPVHAIDLNTMCTTIRVNMTSGVWDMKTLGQGKGTTILLDVQPEEYRTVLNSVPGYTNWKMGFLPKNIWTEYCTRLTYGDHIDFGRWINVPPGYHSWISMSIKWNRPGKAFDGLIFGPPCVAEPKMRFLGNEYYCKELCYYDCALIPVVKYCGCHFQQTKEVPACSVDLIESCAIFVYGKPSSQDKQEVEACYRTCGDPCEYVTLYSTVTFTRFPVPQQLHSYQRVKPEIFGKMSLADVRKRYALVDIFYGSGAIIVTEWQLLSSISLLTSNLGGLMGLYLGISIITIVHAIICFCLEPIKNIFKKTQIKETSTM